MPPLRPLLTVIAICSALVLAGCESDEEKAARHFQSGVALLDAGDTDRALVEFRNVFKYDGFHKEARRIYADAILNRGNVEEAYSQYLRLIEQYPDTVDVRRILAELAIVGGGWSEAERHGKVAIELAPDDPEVQVIAAALAYHQAVTEHDADARARAAAEERALLDRLPDNRVARRIVINETVAGPDPEQALPELDRAIEIEPEALEFYRLKLRLLLQKGDSDAVQAHLQRMQQVFPDDAEVRDTLIKWYMAHKDYDAAETFLRELAGDATGPTDPHMTVVQFLEATQGKEAARAELDRLIAANDGEPNADLYRATRAGMDFAEGRESDAIATIEGILRDASGSDAEQTHRVKLMLARMLEATDNRVGARARVEEVLAEDKSNVEALKMRAAWLIDEDRPGDAIVDLRTALGQAPRDSSVLMLMAAAHERDGDMELAGERLAMAAEVSGGGARESLAYARFLLDQDKVWVARRVLNDARRANPANVEILTLLADIHARAGEWPQAHEILATLQRIDAPEARNAARALQAAILSGQGGIDEGLAFLQDQAESGDPDAVLMAIRSRIRSGQVEDARKQIDAELARRPDDFDLRFLSATLRAAMKDTDAAEDELRALIADEPGSERPAALLYSILAATGRDDEATEVLEAALEALPDSRSLLSIKAGRLEQAEDYEGAIAIYERLYAEDTGNTVIANNLASLLSSQRTDDESLERAYAVSRRLRDLDEPAFKDTYGWIEYRRGNFEAALAYLEAAAEGLPGDALVQLHLGLVYHALDRKEDASRQIGHALDMAGDSDLPQFVEAREMLREMAETP